jgi:hypothetical protein
MKFVLGKKRLYWWPVTVALPDEKRPGKIVHHTFEAELELLDRKEYEAFNNETNEAKSQEERGDVDVRFIKRIVRDWRGIVDDDDQEIGFTDNSLAEALQSNAVRAGILRAILESANGEEARVKN